MPRYHNINGVKVQFTAEEETARDAEEKAWADAAPARALAELRSKRNRLLAETDYLALSDNTLSDDMKKYRQDLRDLPAGKDTVEKSETSARTNVPFPEEWILGEEEFLYGLERYRLGKDVVRKEFERFKQYKIAHHATHRGQIGWDAAFRYWLGNVRVFDKTTPVTTPPRNPAPPAVEIKPEDRVRGQQVEELVARFVGKRSM